MMKLVQMTMLLMSLLYLIIVSVLFFVKKRIFNNDTEIYKRMLFTNFLSIFVELLLYGISV